MMTSPSAEPTRPNPKTQPHPPHRAWLIGVCLWPAFLSAGVATMLFFSGIDPETLRLQTIPDWEISRTAGYSIGFLMFWAVAALSSAVSIFLAHPPRRHYDR
ncbi:MAG: hypothetical protein RI539_05630 [Spiribacter sp.]|jgi:hypothetical protein|nr:hypothetical protein [Spiribacter sp.]MDR9489808.1 hypothetical protein [Spiribacter sp.]